MSDQKVRPELDEVIRAHPVEDGAYLVSWIVVAEWLMPDGERDLALSTSEAMTPWARRGMLGEAAEEEGWQ